MTNHDDELAELSAALDVTPPASFAAGVRARVVRSRVRTRQRWWGLAAAATVTLATVMMWRPAAPATEVATTAVAMPSAPAAPEIERAVEPDAAVRVAAAHPVASPAARLRASAIEVRHEVAPAEPPLVVITNQPAVLRALWADFNGKNLSLVQVEATTSGTGMTPIAVAPIAVEPIVVAPIVVSDIGTGGGRGGATPAIRRVDAARETK